MRFAQYVVFFCICLFIKNSAYRRIHHCFLPNKSFLPRSQMLAYAVSSECKSLVVWDCDGVLVDSEALLKQGEIDALASLGFKLSIDDCVRLFSGVSHDKAAANFFEEYKSVLPSSFFKDQIEASHDLFRKKLKPLMTNTVFKLNRDLGVNMCVASGSPLERVNLCLEIAGIKSCFTEESIFTRELVAKGKPAPDLFLYASAKMGFSPQECLVIEDSAAGIEAAMNANMDVIAFLGGGHATADWYRRSISSYKVPIAHTESEVFELIRSKICK